MAGTATPPFRPLLRALCCALLLCCLGQAQAAVFDPHAIRSETLPNGLRVVVEEEPAASVVAVEVVVRAGAANERPDESGAAHLLEHVLWANGGKDDPRTKIEEMGGVTNAGTLRDFTHYYVTLPAGPGNAALAVRELARVVLRDTLDETVVEREKLVVQNELAGRSDQPQLLLNQLAFETVYGKGHPYGRPLEGDGETFVGLDAAKLGAFRRRWYVPNNMAVIVVGQVAYGEVLSAVQRAFFALKPEAAPDWAVVPPPRPAPPREVKIGISGEDAYVMAAFVGPAIDEPADVCATDTLTMLLTNVTYGRLHRRLQESTQLAKATGVDFLTQKDRALLGVWAVCAPGDVAAVKAAIREELAGLAASVSPQELAAARRLTAADYSFANETPSDRARTLAFYEALSGFREAGQYPLRVRSLRAADVRKAASWYAVDPVWIILSPKKRGA